MWVEVVEVEEVVEEVLWVDVVGVVTIALVQEQGNRLRQALVVLQQRRAVTDQVLLLLLLLLLLPAPQAAEHVIAASLAAAVQGGRERGEVRRCPMCEVGR